MEFGCSAAITWSKDSSVGMGSDAGRIQTARSTQKFAPLSGDVILAMDRPWIEAGLKFAWVKDSDLPCLLVQRVARLRGTNGLLTEHLRYVIADRCFTDYIRPIVTGVAVPHISASQIKAFRFRMPSTETQQKIASDTSAYDDLIENNLRRIKILEEMAQAIYREWFVELRFPGHQKAEWRKATEEENKVLGRDRIPAAWKLQVIKDAIKRLSPGTVYEEDEVSASGTIPVIDQSTNEFLGFHDNEPDLAATAECPIIAFGDHTCKMVLMTSPFSVGPNVVPFAAVENLPVCFAYYAVRDLVETKEHTAALDRTDREEGSGGSNRGDDPVCRESAAHARTDSQVPDGEPESSPHPRPAVAEVGKWGS